MNYRKLALLEYLDKKNGNFSNLQIQKFLFFYEMFQIINDKDYNIKHLKAYKSGPVFSDVVYDFKNYKKNFLVFNTNTKNTSYNIDEENVEKAFSLISTMTDSELSDLTHQLDMWKSKETLINKGQKQIPIEFSDISGKDKEKLKEIFKTILPIYNFQIIKIANKIFLVKNEELDKITDEHYEILDFLSEEKNLINPVYLSFNEKGQLLID